MTCLKIIFNVTRFIRDDVFHHFSNEKKISHRHRREFRPLIEFMHPNHTFSYPVYAERECCLFFAVIQYEYDLSKSANRLNSKFSCEWHSSSLWIFNFCCFVRIEYIGTHFATCTHGIKFYSEWNSNFEWRHNKPSEIGRVVCDRIISIFRKVCRAQNDEFRMCLLSIRAFYGENVSKWELILV